MAKKKLMNPSHVLIFVEGDTDEVFFIALIDYYASVSSNKLLPYDVCNLKGVTRYSSKLLAKLKNEYLPTAKLGSYKIKTVCCSYDTDVFEVKQPQIVKWDAIGKSVKRMGIFIAIMYYCLLFRNRAAKLRRFSHITCEFNNW